MTTLYDELGTLFKSLTEKGIDTLDDLCGEVQYVYYPLCLAWVGLCFILLILGCSIIFLSAIIFEVVLQAAPLIVTAYVIIHWFFKVPVSLPF
jgi:hypothetical protein